MSPTLCLFSGIYPPDTGGPAKFAETFLAFGEKQGVSVKVFAYSQFLGPKSTQKTANLHLVDRQIPLIARYSRAVLFLLRETKAGSRILINGCFWEVALARHLRRFNYVAKVPGDIVWERARNSGLTTSNIDDFQEETLKFKFRLMRYFFTYSLRKAKWVIAPSEHLANLCKKWGVEDQKIIHIKNSVYVPSQNYTGGNEFDFVTVSRLVSWKAVDEVIRVSAQLNAKLLVIGSGPESENLQNLARELNAEVTFLGEVPQEDILQNLIRCSSFVLNSSFEATSYALLEAQVAGLVVIANAGTGSEEIIDHGVTGYLCGSTTGLTLQNAMRIALDNRGEDLSMRIKSQESVSRKYNLETNYVSILELCMA